MGVLCGNIASPKFNSFTFFTPGLQFAVCKVFGLKDKKKMFPIIFHKYIIVEISDNGYMSRFTLYLRVWTFSAVCHLIFILLTPYGRHDMKSAVMFLLPVFCNYESQPIALWQCQFSTLSALNQFEFFFIFSKMIFCVFGQICIWRRAFLRITNYWYRKWWIFGTKNLSLTLDLYKKDISHNVIDELSTYRTNFEISVVSDNSRISVGLCMIFECHFSLRFIQRRSGASTRRYRSTCRRRRC